MNNINLENLEEVFSLMMQENLQCFPLIDLNGNGSKWSIMTDTFVFFVSCEENNGTIGIQKIERGMKTLLGFKVQPKMQKFPIDKTRELCQKCNHSNNIIEENFLVKKIDDNMGKIDMWLALGGEPNNETKKAAAWLEDLWKDNETDPPRFIKVKIEPKLEIFQKILEEPKFKKERKKQKNVKTFDY